MTADDQLAGRSEEPSRSATLLCVADESVDFAIVTRLRSDGTEVEYIAEVSPGAPDEAVLRRALQREALLVTADKDFGELVFRRGQLAAGVLLLRLAGLPAEDKADLVLDVVHRYSVADVFMVLSPSALRVRSLPE